MLYFCFIYTLFFRSPQNLQRPFRRVVMAVHVMQMCNHEAAERQGQKPGPNHQHDVHSTPEPSEDGGEKLWSPKALSWQSQTFSIFLRYSISIITATNPITRSLSHACQKDGCRLHLNLSMCCRLRAVVIKSVYLCALCQSYIEHKEKYSFP